MSRVDRLRRPGRPKRTALAEALAARVTQGEAPFPSGVDAAPTTEEGDGSSNHHVRGWGVPGPRGAGDDVGADAEGWRGGRELRDALEVWLCGARAACYQAVIDRLTGDWLESVAGQPGWDASSMDLLADLASEYGLAMQPDGTPAGTDDNALLAFASDPRVPPAMGRRARNWRFKARYGLWRVDQHPISVPSGTGLTCTDILSGQRRHLIFPKRVRERLVRWATWYGAAVPDERGNWHSTGLGARLSPAEADAAADLILAGATAATLGRSGGPAAEDALRRLRAAMKFGTAEPHGVAVDYEPRFAEPVAITVSRTAGASIARVLAETYQYRASPPAPRNSSDEPACLISARLAVTSPEALRAALLERDDFAPARGNPAVFGWLESVPRRAQRVTLGTIRFGDPGVTGWPEGAGWTGTTVLVQVNSCARFGYLLALLGKLDPGLTISSEKRVDPVLHTAWPAETRTERAVSAEGWEDFWLSSPLAVLGHQTPRQAARGRYLPELVTLLRQLEYQAGLLTLEHKSGLDTGVMRRQLGVTDTPARGGVNRDGGGKRGRGRRLYPFGSTNLFC